MKIIALALIALPSLASAEPLDLECRGAAIVDQKTSTYEWTRQSDGSRSYELKDRSKSLNAAGVIRVRVDDAGKARVRLPASLQNHGRGDDGWWDLTTLEVTDDVIRGKFSIGMLLRARLTIDRRTGDIDYHGPDASFSGTCERVQGAQVRKF
jgi:hypothetical protein